MELSLTVERGSVIHDDVLGRLELGVLLEEHVGPEAGRLADGWDGDRYALIEGAGGDRQLVLYTVWDTDASRDAFVDAVGGVLDRFGGEARLERVEVLGRPASRLTVGRVGGVVVRVRAGGPE